MRIIEPIDEDDENDDEANESESETETETETETENEQGTHGRDSTGKMRRKHPLAYEK